MPSCRTCCDFFVYAPLLPRPQKKEEEPEEEEEDEDMGFGLFD